MVPFGVANVIRRDKTQLHVLTDTRITGEAKHTRERHFALIVEPTLILFRVESATRLRLHVQHLRTVMKSFADRVLKDTTNTKRQLSRDKFDDGASLTFVRSRYEQSAMVQTFLDCVDRATVPSIAFVSFREQPLHFNDNQTLSLRVADPIADDNVWAIIDEGCNSCCHGELWRQKGLTLFGCIGRQLLSMALEPARPVENSHGHSIAGI